jgi:hypothetical protein
MRQQEIPVPPKTKLSSFEAFVRDFGEPFWGLVHLSCSALREKFRFDGGFSLLVSWWNVL